MLYDVGPRLANDDLLGVLRLRLSSFGLSVFVGFVTFGVVGFLPITSANEINFNGFGKDSDLKTIIGRANFNFMKAI